MQFDPKTIALLLGTAGASGLLGWAIRGLKKGASAELAEEIKIDQEHLAEAKKTATPKDDIEWQKRIEAKRRLKAIVDAIPDPP